MCNFACYKRNTVAPLYIMTPLRLVMTSFFVNFQERHCRVHGLANIAHRVGVGDGLRPPPPPRNDADRWSGCLPVALGPVYSSAVKAETPATSNYQEHSPPISHSPAVAAPIETSLFKQMPVSSSTHTFLRSFMTAGFSMRYHLALLLTILP